MVWNLGHCLDNWWDMSLDHLMALVLLFDSSNDF